MIWCLYGQDEMVARFVASMIPHVRARGFGKCRAVGIIDGRDNELIAGVVFHDLAPEAGLMELSAAAIPGRQWVTRSTLRMMYDYCFVECGCQMVVNKVSADDKKHIAELERLGYKKIEFPRLYGRDNDGVVCCLTDDAWMANRIFRRLYRDVDEQEKAA